MNRVEEIPRNIFGCCGRLHSVVVDYDDDKVVCQIVQNAEAT